MLLATVEGSVVATMKDAHVAGRKLLLVRPQFVDAGHQTRFGAGADTLVAVDSVGAGVGEWVVVCQGSPARLVPDLMDAPIDAVVMGIVDVVDVQGQQTLQQQDMIVAACTVGGQASRSVTTLPTRIEL